MIRRKGIPEGGCSMCCRLKMKLEELWQRTSGCILKIRGVTPDGAGNFELEAGQNVSISEVSNGLRISTTGGVSYYTSDDPQLDIDNDDLKISLVDVAKDSDLDVVAQNVANIVNGTTQVGKAAHADTADSAKTAASSTSATNSVNAQYLGSSTNNVGSDTKPVKIVNGQAVKVTNDLTPKAQARIINATGYGFGLIISGKIFMTLPVNLAGRTVTAFAGNIIARKADTDIASYTNVSLTCQTNAIGQVQFFDQQLPGASGTYQDVTFQCEGKWTIA